MRFFKKKVRSRTDASDGHIIITGTGRTGTTLLIQFFTALGFNTGYNVSEALSSVDPTSYAGLERPLIAENSPYVIKSPWYADELMSALEYRQTKIHAALIPMRDIFSAAESRRRVSESGATAGGLWYTDNPETQENALAFQFYKAVYPLIKFRVRTYFFCFPDFADDFEYFWSSIETLLRDHGVRRSEARKVFLEIVDPTKIHRF
ncbi:hypothetical protein [Martelella sp. FOR1707]